MQTSESSRAASPLGIDVVSDVVCPWCRIGKGQLDRAIMHLIRGLAGDPGDGVRAFEASLDRFLRGLPIRPVLLGTVYDPTFGDDARNFLGVQARIARANHRRVNEVIGSLAARYGKLVDLHAHVLTGDPSWFTRTIEPSLIGASEVRRAFLAAL